MRTARAALGLLLGLGALLAAAGLPAPATAAESASVVLENQTAAGADGTIRLTGRVVNDSGAALGGLGVRLRRLGNRLVPREDVPRLATAAVGREGPVAPGTSGAVVPGTLAAGAGATWALTASLPALGLSTPGVYPVGVEVTAGNRPVGLVRTFVQWLPGGYQQSPVQLVRLWPIVARPVRDALGVFTDDHLARELAPGGRLHRLVTAGMGQQVSWVLEADLLESVQQMAAGYSVRADDQTRRLPASPQAAEWLRLLRTATTNAEVLVLPYADADLTGMISSGVDEVTNDIPAVVSTGLASVAQILGRSNVTPVAWPTGGAMTAGMLAQTGRAGVGQTVLSSRHASFESRLKYTPTGLGSVNGAEEGQSRVLVADAQLAEGLAEAGASPTAVGLAGPAVQRFRADTLLIALEQPGSAPRTLVLAPPKRWDPSPQLLGHLLEPLPWAQPSSVAQLTAQPPGGQVRLDYPAAARRQQLPADWFTTVRDQHRQMRLFLELLSTPQRVTDHYPPAFRRALSSAWRSLPKVGDGYLSGVEEQLAREMGAVRVAERPRITLSSRSGVIPITVTNSLQQEVRVGLWLDAPPARLRLVRPTELKDIPRGRQVVINVEAEALANGPVQMQAQLRTPAGRPYGPVVQFRIEATSYGLVGMVVAGSAAVLLFLAAGVRVWRRRRGTANDQPEQGGLPPEGAPDPAAGATADERVNG